MKRTQWILLAIMFSVVIGAVLYRQYRFYRTPADRLAQEFDVRTDDFMTNDPGTSSPITQPLSNIRITNGVRHSIPLDDIISGGPPKDGIPSIDTPKFENKANADQYLSDDGFGLLVEVKGTARFYPYQILVWHEIVNDTIEGVPLLVTYCPLCFTGIVFERTIDKQPVEFGTSGKLWNSNLLMYDRKTDSLWSQALGESVVGEKTGEKLVHYPSLTMSWADVKNTFAEVEVLSRSTGAVRDYTQDPYGSYYTNNSALFFPVANTDTRLPSKELIYGMRAGDARKAYAEKDVQEAGVINDVVGNTSVVVFFDTEKNAVRSFDRDLLAGENNKAEIFEFKIEEGVLVDKKTGQIVTFDGDLVDKETGKTKVELATEAQGDVGCHFCALQPIVLENSFWFSWAATFPNTELYEQDK